MSNTLVRTHDETPGADRRAYLRQPLRSLAYVELDEGNGGIVLNVSEGGLSVQAVTSLMDDLLPELRFQLSETESWIEASARISWTSESRKLAGLEFLNLSDDSRTRIRAWLNRESLPEAPAEGASASTAAEEEEREAPATAGIPEPAASVTQPFEPFLAPVASTEFVIAPAEPSAQPTAVPQIEEASNALVDLLTSVSELAPRAAGIALEAPVAEPAAKPAPRAAARKTWNIEKLMENHWPAATALLVLALASLVAGWAAGQGTLGRYFAKIPRGLPQVAGKLAAATAAPPAGPAEIEVLSASNQRWVIPFNGPASPSADADRRSAPARVAPSPAVSPARKPDSGFRTWVLSPPSRTRTADNGGLNQPPPVLPDSSGMGETLLGSAAMPAPPAPAATGPTGIVKQGQLIRRVDPGYPLIAKEQHAEGTVRLNVTVSPDGMVRSVALLGGPRLLVDAAEKAVRQWRYTPTLLDGKPVEFQREVDLTFRLSGATN